MPKTKFFMPYFIFLCAIFIIVLSFSIVLAQTNSNSNTNTVSNTNTAAYPIVNFSTNKTLIYTGLPTGAQSATLTWSTFGAVSCTAFNATTWSGWTGTKALSGSLSISPVAKNTYYLTCKNLAGYPTQKSLVIDVQAAFRRGDANRDGNVNVSDISTIVNGGADQLRPVFKAKNSSLISPCYDAADVDDNGVIQLADAIRLIQFLFSGGLAPAAPGNVTKGPDPTADSLKCLIYP